MDRINVFADESGNFDFSRKSGASRFFILTTIACARYDVGDALLSLRRDLAWEGLGLISEFHATTDSQVIRDRVVEVIRRHPFQIDTTILEKAKAAPVERLDEQQFYALAWKEHMRGFADARGDTAAEMFLVSAALGTKRKRHSMYTAVQAAVGQTYPSTKIRVASWHAQSDPCLQVADYCSWAIQRKWEIGDPRSYDLIRSKIILEREVWKERSSLHY